MPSICLRHVASGDEMSDEQLNARTDERHAAELRRIANVLREIWGHGPGMPCSAQSGAQFAALADAAALLEGYAAEPLHPPPSVSIAPKNLPDRWDYDEKTNSVICGGCMFRYGADHPDSDGKWTCPNCGDGNGEPQPAPLGRAIEALKIQFEAIAHSYSGYLPELGTADSRSRDMLIKDCSAKFYTTLDAILAATPAPSADCAADTDLLSWLQDQIVDTIYLDDGRIIDVKGNDVREAIRALASAKEDEKEPPK